jgi:hypothetical protein
MIHDDGYKRVHQLISAMDRTVNLFKTYNVKKYYRIQTLHTCKEFQNQGAWVSSAAVLSPDDEIRMTL